jgi:hypothetical protein
MLPIGFGVKRSNVLDKEIKRFLDANSINPFHLNLPYHTHWGKDDPYTYIDFWVKRSSVLDDEISK